MLTALEGLGHRWRSKHGKPSRTLRSDVPSLTWLMMLSGPDWRMTEGMATLSSLLMPPLVHQVPHLRSPWHRLYLHGVGINQPRGFFFFFFSCRYQASRVTQHGSVTLSPAKQYSFCMITISREQDFRCGSHKPLPSSSSSCVTLFLKGRHGQPCDGSSLRLTSRISQGIADVSISRWYWEKPPFSDSTAGILYSASWVPSPQFCAKWISVKGYKLGICLSPPGQMSTPDQKSRAHQVL